MVSASNSPASASGPATPTNQMNGAAPLPTSQKDALAIIQRDFRSKLRHSEPHQAYFRHVSQHSAGDTITIPDQEMHQLMASASVGDDVYRQDRATNALQERIAKLAGKEAALFCVTGTMTNREQSLNRAHGSVLSDHSRRTRYPNTPDSAAALCDLRFSSSYTSLRGGRYCSSFPSHDHAGYRFQRQAYHSRGHPSKLDPRARYSFLPHPSHLLGKHTPGHGLSSRRDCPH